MKFIIAILFFFFIACNNKQGRKTTLEIVPSDTITELNDNKPINDTILKSERIDGPANIRDTVNGKLLFSFNDNVAVEVTDPKNDWQQVGVLLDLTQEQMDSLFIAKGSKLFVAGQGVGQTFEKVHLSGAFKSKEGLKGELIGYTSTSNIKPNSIVEKVFSTIVNSKSKALTQNDFKQFIKEFQFTNADGLLAQFKGYEIDENWIDDPSPLLRIWLLFKGDKFYGVFHSRQLNLNGATTIKVKRGFYYSTFNQDEK